MNRRTYEPDDETGQLLAHALQARTADIHGRPDSLADLRRAYRRENSRRTSRSPRQRRLSSVVGIIATAAAVLLVVVGINWIGRDYKPATTPTRPTHSSAPLKKTGFGYSPADYYPAVRSDGLPVIVRVSDGQQMRELPRGRENTKTWAPLSPMILSPDGNQVYGVGRDLQENGQPYTEIENADHVLSIDLRTNQFTSLATRQERIVGLALSADGTTFAYSQRGGQDGQPDRDVIYVHNLVHDTDRHFLLAKGQRTVIMALSPDGSQLAINVNSNSAAVQVMSTTSGIAQPPQQLLGATGCDNPSFGPVQWTQTGLYAVRYCGAVGAGQTGSVIRLGTEPDQAATVKSIAFTGRTAALLVCDSRLDFSIFTRSGADFVVIKLATAVVDRSVLLHGIQLAGPGT
jgi:hypothetical protein